MARRSSQFPQLPDGRPMPRRRFGSSAVAVTAGLLVAVIATLAPTRLPGAPAGLSGGVAAAASGGPSGTVSLVSQTPWVTSTSGMNLVLAVNSKVPPSDLEVQLTLYNELTRRYDFEQTTYQNQFPTSFVQGDSAALPLTTKGLVQPDGNIGTVIRLAPPAVPGPAPRTPRDGAVFTLPCDSACAGVYPLEVSLLDSATGYATLSQFTTYLVVVPQSVASPLRFSFVLPVGSSPALDPNGAPAILAADEAEISTLDRAMAAHPNSAVSLALYPQLSDALTRAANARLPAGGSRASRAAVAARSNALHALAALRQLVRRRNVEAATTTYTPVNLAAMAGEHLGSEAARQIGASGSSLAALGINGPRPFVTATPVGPGALGVLTREGERQVLVPSDSVTAVPPSWDFPVWAPFRVKGSQAVVDASDAELEHYVSGSSNQVLHAEQLLADLAIVYYVEQPPGNRGMTLLAPRDWRPSAAFLATLLSGLSSSPVVKPVTLSQFFQQVPAGSDEVPAGATTSPILYRGLDAGSTLNADGLPTGAIASARSDLSALASLLPPDSNQVVTLERLVLLGETAGLQRARRLAYLGAPAAMLHRAASEVSLPSGRTITITSLSARVPILVSSRAPVPLSVELHLSSCPPFSAPGGCSGTVSIDRRPHSFVLVRGNHTVEIHVSARSSGDFFLYLQLTTPTGTVLASDRLQIRSTAISGVAIVLTVAAAVFLVVWWGRSALRRRRGRHARRTAHASSAGSGGADGPHEAASGGRDPTSLRSAP